MSENQFLFELPHTTCVGKEIIALKKVKNIKQRDLNAFFFTKKLEDIKTFISVLRRETRREASPRSTQRASCHSHVGKQNNIITRAILISAMRFIEQKVILFRCRTDNLDELARPDPTRPGPTRPGHDAL